MNEIIYALKYLFIATLVIVCYFSKSSVFWKIAQVMAILNPGVAWLPLSGTHVWTVLTHRVAGPAKQILPKGTWVGGLLLAILSFYLAAFFWSSDSFQGIRFIASAVTLYLLTLAVRRTVQGPMYVLDIIARATMPLGVVQAVSTILFMAFPALEETYLKSALAPIFLGPRAQFLYTTMPDNVIYDDKSGGLLFYNGNTASMVMGVWALSILIFAFRVRSRGSFFAAIVCLLGSFATGSKSGLMLAIVIPLFVGLVVFASRGSRKTGPFLITTLSAGFVLLFSPVYKAPLDTYLASSDNSSRARDLLWNAAAQAFDSSPIWGLGWGGWEALWPSMSVGTGLLPTLPPHNFLIQTWAQAGLFPVIAVVLLFTTTFVRLAVQVLRANTVEPARTGALLMGILAWIFFHGMYDTTAFFGVEPLIPLLACLLVLSEGSNVKPVEVPRERVKSECP